MTRIQKERFDDPAVYERLAGSYVLDAEKMKLAGPGCIVLHPLPRVDEIAVDVDGDPRACYFKQVLNGKYMRRALILKLIREAEAKPDTKELGIATRLKRMPEEQAKRCRCGNPKCITFTEPSTPNIFVTEDGENYRCAYCETAL